MTANHSRKAIPEPLVMDWPLSAADLLHIRHVLSQDSRLTYGVRVHEGDGVRPHTHVVFLVRL